jgi:hypothetical protein
MIGNPHELIPPPRADLPSRNPGDEASPTAPQTAENICRACGGTGRVDRKPCPDCGGTGRVTETVGDA